MSRACELCAEFTACTQVDAGPGAARADGDGERRRDPLALRARAREPHAARRAPRVRGAERRRTQQHGARSRRQMYAGCTCTRSCAHEKRVNASLNTSPPLIVMHSAGDVKSARAQNGGAFGIPSTPMYELLILTLYCWQALTLTLTAINCYLPFCNNPSAWIVGA